MDPAAAFILVASDDEVAELRDALARRGVLAWSSGRLLALRVGPEQVVTMLAPMARVGGARVFGGALPGEVLESLPRGTRMMISAQQTPEPKKGPAPVGLAWDTPGFEAPRHLKHQG